MSKRNIYLNHGSSRAAREDLYGELSNEGKFFVGYFAWHLLQAMKARGRAPLGEVGARELAMAVLQNCWDGEIPAGYPALVAPLASRTERGTSSPQMRLESAEFVGKETERLCSQE
jgi:hypothetical protein